MHNMNMAEIILFDRKVKKACSDPTLQLQEIADLVGTNLSALARSMRRQNLSRPLPHGRPKVSMKAPAGKRMEPCEHCGGRGYHWVDEDAEIAAEVS